MMISFREKCECTALGLFMVWSSGLHPAFVMPTIDLFLIKRQFAIASESLSIICLMFLYSTSCI
ncbi:hypothetical protein DJ030_15855 [bacterium endosymbiont of Escarpia laminata]|nr:MAG: hypothetical protein DJ030_15855 [bacterium endosymbiont of Escarpia laminata]